MENIITEYSFLEHQFEKHLQIYSPAYIDSNYSLEEN